VKYAFIILSLLWVIDSGLNFSMYKRGKGKRFLRISIIQFILAAAMFVYFIHEY
jgi:hypothetical protein